MNDEDLLRSALGTLTVDQPPAPDRVLGVQRRVRRRTRQRAAVAGALALSGVVGAAVLLQPGDAVDRTLPPAGPGLPWEPRGELVDEADVAVRAWAPEGARDLSVLYAGALAPVDGLRPPPKASAERWYVLQGDPGDGPQVAVLRDRDGTGPAGPEVVGQRRPQARDRQLSVLLTEVPAAAGAVVWPGKDGVELTSTLFVLPRPQARSVVRQRLQADTTSDVVVLPDGPSLTVFPTPTAGVQLRVDRSAFVRAGMPGSTPGTLTLAPPEVPAGWVVATSGTGAGTTSGGPAYGVPVRVLVRCTTWDGPLRLKYRQPGVEQQTDVICDGTTQEPLGVVDPSTDAGVAPEDRQDLLSLDGGDGVDQVHHAVVVRRADADRLGIRPPTG